MVFVREVVSKLVAQVWRLVPLGSLLTPAMPQVLEIGHTTDRYINRLQLYRHCRSPLVIGCLPLNPKLTSKKAKLLAYLNTAKSSVENNESAGTKLLSDIEKELLETDKLLKGVLNCIDKCEKQI